MAKARRMKEKEHKTFPKLLKYFFVFMILVTIVFFVLFYLIKTNKIAFLSRFFENIITHNIENNIDNDSNNNSNNDTLKFNDSKIEYEKTIDNLETIKVTDIKVQHSSKLSYVTITIQNTSDKKIKKQKIHLSLLDDKKEYVYGSTIDLSNIEANSKKDFKIVSSKLIETVSDYEIELVK